MGLSAELLVVRAFPTYGNAEPFKKYGWPLSEERMVAMEWHKHHWVHGLLCVDHEGANDCRDVELTSSELFVLAEKLEAWADDKDAIPACPQQFWGPFFGAHPDNPGYEEARDEYRTDAKEEAAKIREAAAWVEEEPFSTKRERCGDVRMLVKPYRIAVYKASW